MPADTDKAIQRWRIPAMEREPGKVLRDEDEASIPTAEEIEGWRQAAEDEGYRQGLERARADTAQTERRLLELINFFEHPLQSLSEEIEQQLTQLAVTLAQQLVRRELKVAPGEIIGLIRDSIKLLPGNTRKISVKLHPDDAQLVRNALSMDEANEEQSWKLVEDPMMTRGGCEIFAPPSAINAQLENRLSELAASVLGGEREADG